MKWIAKALLFLTTMALPVFIAACYGAPHNYTRTDKAAGPAKMKVIDEETDPAGSKDEAKPDDEAEAGQADEEAGAGQD